MMLSNLKVSTRLILFTAFLLLALLIMGVTSLVLTRNIADILTEIDENHLPSVIVISDIRFEISKLHILEKNHIIAGDAQQIAELDSEITTQRAKIEQL